LAWVITIIIVRKSLLSLHNCVVFISLSVTTQSILSISTVDINRGAKSFTTSEHVQHRCLTWSELALCCPQNRIHVMGTGDQFSISHIQMQQQVTCCLLCSCSTFIRPILLFSCLLQNCHHHCCVESEAMTLHSCLMPQKTTSSPLGYKGELFRKLHLMPTP